MGELLDRITNRLDELLNVRELNQDPSFSKFVPAVYEEQGTDWKSFFEADFTKRFNGLMMRGADEVQTVFTGVFPSEEVLDVFLAEANPGDLLVLHHPLDTRSGDPKGEWGRGVIPIPERYLEQIRIQKLSVYACHAPMDYNKKVGTNAAIAEAMGGKVIDEYMKFGNGYVCFLCEIEPISTERFIEKLKVMFDIPYVDLKGRTDNIITKIGILAGGGDNIEAMRQSEKRGAQAYLSGEIHSRIMDPKYDELHLVINEFSQMTSMSLIGVSHAASEFLVMKTQLKRWLNEHFNVKVKPLAEKHWWR